MKQKKYNYEKATIELISFTYDALKRHMTLHNFGKDLRIMVNSYIGLTRSERKILFDTYYNLMRNLKAQREEARWNRILSSRTVYDKLMTTSRKIQASFNLRKKRIATKLSLSDSNTIFFLCSQHNDCAEDHLPYQGRIYVDRFWRTKVNGDLYYKVASYIKNHDVLTIQDVMSGPPYLTTRPYCRHYFSPIPTSTVLKTSVRKILQENQMKHNKLKGDPLERYYKQRMKVYTILNKKFPNENFKLMSQKSNGQ